ncbi:STRESS-RESPONSE A/B BARREL DOMAIN-CONTAINING PROTEIN UP3 [Salix viminalis]|uniref:STRESS-RESPONSE A/B BARREL DOMAIN-CONTAINING PROTEIN UP3 n=1 Tax=Salix viminalis TaxID=40686 RepID=A0A9Q0Z7U7_SALVM|nr:STRESS-RESPONSE A/B BARREL DOMAIN-CONTAINING PROTEIN UP3 [Salix viminalis]
MTMLCLKAGNLLSTKPFHLHFPVPKHQLSPFFPSFKPSSSASRSQIRMSSSSTSPQTIEHIVLLKVKENTDPTKVNTMIHSLNRLISLDSVLHLTAGALYRTKSSPIPFTHMLHSRYSSKENLSAYALHPTHVQVVQESILPICDDIMAVDWVTDDLNGGDSLVPPSGSAMRLTFLKLKEGLGDEVKYEILGVIKGIKDTFGGIDHISCGENFSPARAKGYSIASLAVFRGLSELEAVDSAKELANLEKAKVRDYLESVMVLDYVVSSSSV